jgi:hypothetical protein
MARRTARRNTDIGRNRIESPHEIRSGKARDKAGWHDTPNSLGRTLPTGVTQFRDGESDRAGDTELCKQVVGRESQVQPFVHPTRGGHQVEKIND